jgi:hypothetical protein
MYKGVISEQQKGAGVNPMGAHSGVHQGKPGESMLRQRAQ